MTGNLITVTGYPRFEALQFAEAVQDVEAAPTVVTMTVVERGGELTARLCNFGYNRAHATGSRTLAH